MIWGCDYFTSVAELVEAPYLVIILPITGIG